MHWRDHLGGIIVFSELLADHRGEEIAPKVNNNHYYNTS